MEGEVSNHDAIVEARIQRSRAAMERNISRSIARNEAKKVAAAAKKQAMEELMSTPIEHIKAIIAKGNVSENATPEEIEAATLFKESQEYKKALRDLETRQRQDRLLTAASMTEITPEQRAAAGYTAVPVGMAPPATISVVELRSELKSRAVPIPRDFLKTGVFGDQDSVVFGADGSNLLGGPTPGCVLNLEHKGCATDSEEGGAIIASSGSIVYDAIISLELAQELGIKREDLVVTNENQGEIKRYLCNNEHGLALVKPFSIQAGIAGFTKVNGKDALIAFDHPDIRTGQPGQLFAIVPDGVFRKAPTEQVNYNPNVEFDLVTTTIKDDTLALAQAAATETLPPAIANSYNKPEPIVAALTEVLVPTGNTTEQIAVPAVPAVPAVLDADSPQGLYKAVMNLSQQVSKLMERVSALEAAM